MTAPEAAHPAPEVLRLCQVAVLVGDDTEIDMSVPAGVPLIAVTEDLIPQINDELRRRGRAMLDTKRTYQLCRANARPLDPQRTLDECRVLDGDQLWLLPAEATETFEPIVEHVSTAIARSAAKQFNKLDDATARRVANWSTAALVAWAEVILARQWSHDHGWVPAAVSWIVAVVLLFTAALAARARNEQVRAAADGLAWSALIPAGAAAFMSVPGRPDGWHVMLAAVVVLAGVILLGVLTDRHMEAVAALSTVAVFVAPVAALRASGWQVPPERVAVVVLLAVVIVVTYATNIGGLGSGVPMPVFPSITQRGVLERLPGAPRNTVSPVTPTGAHPPHKIAAWARRGTQIVTGVLIGAGLVAVVAARYAVTPGHGGAWRYLAFTLGICVILLLRARSFVDRVQSITIMLAAMAAAAAVIGRYAAAPATPVLTTTLWCVAAVAALVVLGLVAGLVLPTAQIHAPVRWTFQLTEWTLVALIIPWTLWLLNALSVVRNWSGHN